MTKRLLILLGILLAILSRADPPRAAISQVSCPGTEVIGDPITINPGATWTDTYVTDYYPDVRVTYTFFNPQAAQIPATLSLYTYSEDVTIATTDAQFFQWPIRFTMGPTATMSVENNGDTPLYLHGACLEGRDSYWTGQRGAANTCYNSDPDMNEEYLWDTNGTWAFVGESRDHVVLLEAGEFVRKPARLEAGEYMMRVYIAPDAAVTNPREIYVFNKAHVIQPGQMGTSWPYDSDPIVLDSEGVIYTEVQANPRNTGRPVRVSYICITDLEEPEPTPTPQPTATPPGPVGNCVNLDPHFNFPSQWSPSDPVHDGKLYLAANDSVNQDLNLNTGLYHAYAVLQTDSIGNSLQVIAGDPATGPVTYFDYTTVQGSWAPAEFDFEINGNRDNTLIIRRDIVGDPGTIVLDSFCISEIAPTPTPQSTNTPVPIPTQTPAPTQTPGGPTATNTPIPTNTPVPTDTPSPTDTPEPTPTMSASRDETCVNDDPNIDTGDYWHLQGAGSIISSIAYMQHGDLLIEAVPQAEASEAYYVYIQYKTSFSGTLTLNWRGYTQPFKPRADDTWHMKTILVPAHNQQTRGLAQPMWGLDPDDRIVQPTPVSVQTLWGVSPLRSPLYAPNAPANSPAQNQLTIQSGGGNISVESVCVVPAYTLPDDDAEEPVTFWHPTCDRDYAIQRSYLEDSPYMRIGLGGRDGMPVHAVMAGIVDRYDVTVDGIGADCVVIRHNELNTPVNSYYCGMEEYRIPQSSVVVRGGFIGYADDLLAAALEINGEYVDPNEYYEGYPDCRPYKVHLDHPGRCSADNGNEWINPRYNPATPTLWDVSEYIPWLSYKLYDMAAYPILCALIPMYNGLISFMEDALNAILDALTPMTTAAYRSSKMSGYVTGEVARLFTEIGGIFQGIAQLLQCIRSIVEYFMSAIKSASRANLEFDTLLPSDLMTVAIGIVLTLMQSTVANVLLLPMTALLIAFASWRLIPWGIREIRQAVGFMGEE